jgi:hypothetical protein
MPTSNYAAFHVNFIAPDGTISHVPSASVKAHNVDTNTAITTLTADGSGQIVAGTLSVDVGTRVAFRVENSTGRAGSAEQITT